MLDLDWAGTKGGFSNWAGVTDWGSRTGIRRLFSCQEVGVGSQRLETIGDGGIVQLPLFP